MKKLAVLIIVLCVASGLYALKTNPVNTDNPADSTRPSLGAGYIRTLAASVIELFAVDHFTGTSNPYNLDAAGEHKQVTFNAPRTNPATVAATKGMLYTKVVGGKSELCWIDEDKQVKQLTTVGKLNVAVTEAVLLTGDQTIAGAKTFSGSPITVESDPIVTNGAPALIFQDTDGGFIRLISDNDKLLIQKDNAVDFVGCETLATFETDTAYGMTPVAVTDATQTVTLANGLIMKADRTAHTADGDKAISFGAAFPNVCYAVVVTPEASGDDAMNIQLKGTPSKTGFTVRVEGSSLLTAFHWVAYGR